MNIDNNRINLKEKDLEDYLWEHPQEVPNVNHWIARQFKVPSGIIDLLGISLGGTAIVVELKNTEIDSDAIAQVCRYAWDVEQILVRVEGDDLYQAEKIVIGTGIKNAAMFEANAMGVDVLSFVFELSMDFRRTDWREETRSKIEGEYLEIANSGVFVDFVLEPEEETPSEPIPEILERKE